MRTAGCLLCILLVALARPAHAEALLVLAAASTTEALEEAGRAFTAAEGHEVRFAFGGSGDLARQVVAGAPADVFLSADAARMDAVEAAGRVQPGTRGDLLSNRLVVVVPVGEEQAPAGPGQLRQVRRLALADPATVPAGQYARAWLEQQGLWEALSPKVVPTLDVRAALAAVEAERVDAGVVYSTDAATSRRVRVAFSVPEGQAPRIVYPVAALKGGKAPRAGKAFVHFLRGEAARRIFARHGFLVLGGDKPETEP